MYGWRLILSSFDHSLTEKMENWTETLACLMNFFKKLNVPLAVISSRLNSELISLELLNTFIWDELLRLVVDNGVARGVEGVVKSVLVFGEPSKEDAFVTGATAPVIAFAIE